jgi:LuxR family transcriptional regulator, maltose regulon positive regulatory protein
MAALLGRLVTAKQAQAGVAGGVPAGYLAQLAQVFRQAGLSTTVHPARGGAPPGLVVPLTGRELEVLMLLAAGQANQAIAEELVITLDTVKRHVTHILDKLGVANRAQAVTRARELGLLQ